MPPVKNKPRALVVAHNHPALFPGGGEILAHALFEGLKREGSFTPYFLAATGPHTSSRKPGALLSGFGTEGDEFLLWDERFDYFLQSQPDLPVLTREFTQLLKKLKPDIVHFHHTLRIGMEALRVVRDTLPQAVIFYTLHDFIPICHRDGQMVRLQDDALCDNATATRCAECFPQTGPARFLLRESFIKAHLALVDHFISPSRFLAQRYVEWGIPSDRMRVIHNGHLHKHMVHKEKPRQKRNRFAFFGQVTPYKGVLLLLEAVRQMQSSGFQNFMLSIHGSAELQQPGFQRRFHAALQEAGPCVLYHGPYRREDLLQLMQKTDWVVMPSTWWENAPLVIDEAFASGRPVICSNIGGMAEKVTDGKTGLHFPAGNAALLAATMRRAAEDTGLWKRLAVRITPPVTAEACVGEHVMAYQAALGIRKSQSPILWKDTAAPKRAGRG